MSGEDDVGKQEAESFLLHVASERYQQVVASLLAVKFLETSHAARTMVDKVGTPQEILKNDQSISIPASRNQQPGSSKQEDNTEDTTLTFAFARLLFFPLLAHALLLLAPVELHLAPLGALLLAQLARLREPLLALALEALELPTAAVDDLFLERGLIAQHPCQTLLLLEVLGVLLLALTGQLLRRKRGV